MNSSFNAFLQDVLNFDLDNDFIFIKDKDLNYIYANKKFCNFFNVSLEDLYGKKDSYFLDDSFYINKCRESDLLALKNNFAISDEALFKESYRVLKLKINLETDSPGILCLARTCSK